MRQITVKYQGECAKCGETLDVGALAEYEKTTGIFCVGHFPTDPEEIRSYRLGKAERRAERYEEWAEKREAKASAQLNSYPEIRHDWAFITQPGHIPFRARMNASDERAHESLQVANRMREKAESLRHVRVKGDAERRNEARRAAVEQWIKPGIMADSCHFGIVEIVKVNKKTLTIRKGPGRTFTHDKMFFSPVKGEQS